jgi:cellulose synthase/poly-beta-1,6-N-acetylglucosamine synthase-like glycosyltransferase
VSQILLAQSFFMDPSFNSMSSTGITPDGPTIFAGIVLWLTFLWALFLIFDVQRRSDSPSLLSSSRLLLHTIPALFLFGTAVTSQIVNDSALVWLVALLVFRYWRTVVNIAFWFKYKPALPTGKEKMLATDCTVIVPTVGPIGNPVFGEMVAGILANGPARLIFSTNTVDAAKQVEDYLRGLCAAFKAGATAYQQEWGLGAMEILTDITVINANVSNKRQQVVHGFGEVKTGILVMVDDTAMWHPQFLQASLPAFNNDKVGFVGTRKWVKRLPRVTCPNAGFLKNLALQYWSGFWNTIGGLYLVRHNFEIRATNAADGGVFCVSGRSSLIRASIVKDVEFKHAFLNEYVLRFGDRFPGWGPVTADDDNFITRWVINAGWTIKIQSSKEATMTTVLGKLDPLKFPDQCKRWSRTTFRQNPIALFADRTVWWEWPLTTWTTILPWLYNAALIRDGLAIYVLTQTKMYAESAHPTAILCGLIVFIWLSKLVKTIPWFSAYPVDFLLYFVIPAYPMFAYYHSILKIWTAFTFWDLAWSGRKLPNSPKSKAG